MTPLYRKIRKKMTNENKPIKYARYALGEIVLVVIGILIALQINTWNEERKERIEEKILLTNLKNEIDSNQKEIQLFLAYHGSSLRMLEKFLKEVGPEADHRKIDSLDHSIASIMWIPEYQPKNGTLNSIVTSGKVNLIHNDSIIDLLSLWKSELEDYYANTIVIRQMNIQSINPVILKSYPAKDWASSVGATKTNKSMHKFPINELLRNPEFENLLLMRTINAEELFQKIKNLMAIQSSLIKKIDDALVKSPNP